MKGVLKGRGNGRISGCQHKSTDIEAQINILDLKLQSEGLSEAEKASRISLRSDLWKAYRAEEVMWRQKSRVAWLKEGDRNTSFFHLVATARRRSNCLGFLTHNGQVVRGPQEVKNMVFEHFQDLYQQAEGCLLSMENYNFRSISQAMACGLEASFSEMEVVAALEECKGDKAPGPDDFNFGFLKKKWVLVKGEVMSFLSDFHVYGKLSGGLNSTFIAPIPKTKAPDDITDFRPICLIGSIYKLLANILANRLKTVMALVVSP